MRQVADCSNWSVAETREIATDGTYYSAANPEIRSASWWCPCDDYRIFQAFDRKIDRVIKPLIRQIWGIDLADHSGTQLIRYRAGGHYVAHSDAGMDYEDRYFTVVCYLNDDFSGGNTTFPSLNCSTAPQAGRAILFPSAYFHTAEPVLSGEKYVIVTWVTGPKPIRWI
jgi:Rps23 Pro-64 3,4-dihydroxylase Tpa1-like proline 4-hydroxylase